MRLVLPPKNKSGRAGVCTASSIKKVFRMVQRSIRKKAGRHYGIADHERTVTSIPDDIEVVSDGGPEIFWLFDSGLRRLIAVSQLFATRLAEELSKLADLRYCDALVGRCPYAICHLGTGP